jgi:hypothetical protein
MKKVYKILENNMYGVPVTIFIGSYAESESYLHRNFGLERSEQRYYGGTTSLMTDTKNGHSFVYIWMPHYNHTIDEMGTLTHECTHAAMRILEACSIPVTYKDHESLAYLQSYIFMEALAAMRHRIS